MYALLLRERLDIVDFCLIQEAADQIRLEVRPGPRFDEHQQQAVLRLLRGSFPARVTVAVAAVAVLTKTASGKRNPILSRVNGALRDY